MKLENLIFLENDPVAQRMVASWPTVKSIGKNKKKLTFDAIEEWAEKSGVMIESALERWPSLFSNKICYPGGRVDPLAIKYVQRKFARKMGILGDDEEKGSKTSTPNATGTGEEAKTEPQKANHASP